VLQHGVVALQQVVAADVQRSVVALQHLLLQRLLQCCNLVGCVKAAIYDGRVKEGGLRWRTDVASVKMASNKHLWRAIAVRTSKP